MPNFFAGSMSINLSLTHFEELAVTTDDPIVDLNPWQCEVLSVGASAMAMPELGFDNAGGAHVLRWSSAPVDADRRAALRAALVRRRSLRIRIGYDLHQSADLSVPLRLIASPLHDDAAVPLDAGELDQPDAAQARDVLAHALTAGESEHG